MEGYKERPPSADFTMAVCHGCGKRDRVYECYRSAICLACYRSLIEIAIKAEGDDDNAAS